VHQFVAALKAKRELLVGGLNAIEGVRCASPAGAFYAFPDFSGILDRVGMTCESLAERLLAEAHTAVLAGTAFGPGGQGHLRLSYASPGPEVALGLERIRSWVGNLTTAAAT
jgi:aspartate/methionine/tyrosine aminotransferase